MGYINFYSLGASAVNDIETNSGCRLTVVLLRIYQAPIQRTLVQNTKLFVVVHQTRAIAKSISSVHSLRNPGMGIRLLAY